MLMMKCVWCMCSFSFIPLRFMILCRWLALMTSTVSMIYAVTDRNISCISQKYRLVRLKSLVWFHLLIFISKVDSIILQSNPYSPSFPHWFIARLLFSLLLITLLHNIVMIMMSMVCSSKHNSRQNRWILIQPDIEFIHTRREHIQFFSSVHTYIRLQSEPTSFADKIGKEIPP